MHPSAAHEKSFSEVIDPAYSSGSQAPVHGESVYWLYPRAEYACFLLSSMRRDVVALKLKVGYPGCFKQPSATSYFRKHINPGILELKINGEVRATLDRGEVDVIVGDDSDAAIMTHSDGMLLLKVSVHDTAESIPAIYSDEDGWEASTDGVLFTRACREAAPTGEKLPTVEVPLVESAPGVLDAGREVLACLEIASDSKPRLRVGESMPELSNRDASKAEQTTELEQAGPSRWHTPLPLAFRFAAVESESPFTVSCKAVFTPESYRGAFHADSELDSIWMRSAYTLRLCMHRFMLDGIKRDRLPWLGDLSISLMANAYTFADPVPVKRTLAAIGRAGIQEQHLNGIIDYTLWYFICHDLYQLYFADHDFLVEQYGEIKEILGDILKIADANGGLLPDKSGWCFIDWLEIEKGTALQMIFHMALLSAAKLADRMNDVATSTRCRDTAQALKDRLIETAFDDEAGLFFSTPGNPDSGFLRHPNFLAVVGGLTPDELSAHIADALLSDKLPPTGTPFMASLEILALHRGGRSAEAIEKIRRTWGGMLKHGATTFFEAYKENATEAEMLSFYGRPYAMSLCHAWSSGPAALLPLIGFGCEPTADGWAQSRVAATSPFQNACAAVPAGKLTICVESVGGQIEFSKVEGPCSQTI